MSYKFRNHIKNNKFITTRVYEENKFIYMKPGRSASTTIVDTINQDNIEVSKPYYLEEGADDWLENITDDEISNDYFVFTFVRNPFERLVSAWNVFNKRQTDVKPQLHRVANNFSSFVVDRGSKNLRYEDGSFTNDHWFPQSNYVEYSDGCRFVDYVGKFENLEEDWKTLAGKINIEENITKEEHSSVNYKEFYTEKLVEIVSDIYKRDLELFDYGF